MVENPQTSIKLKREDKQSQATMVRPVAGSNQIDLTLIPGEYSVTAIEEGVGELTSAIRLELQAGESQVINISSKHGSAVQVASTVAPPDDKPTINLNGTRDVSKDPPTKPGTASHNLPPVKSPVALEELRKLVHLASQNLDRARALFTAAKVTRAEVLGAESNWVAARLRLAEAEGGGTKSTRPLVQELVRLHEERLTLLRSLVQSGIAPLSDLNAAERELSEARIRLSELPAEPPHQ